MILNNTNTVPGFQSQAPQDYFARAAQSAAVSTHSLRGVGDIGPMQPGSTTQQFAVMGGIAIVMYLLWKRAR